MYYIYILHIIGEFTGLDLEMEIKENYYELMDLMGDLFVYIFNGIEKRFT